MARFEGSQCALPSEILDSIIDLLHQDWRTLAACFQTSSALSPRARYHISRNVIVLLGVNRNADARDFMRIFPRRSPLAKLPTSLDIRGRVDIQIFFTDLLHFDHLRHVRTLKLSFYEVLNTAKLRSLYLSIRRLEELCIYRLRKVYRTTEEIRAGDPRNQVFCPPAATCGGPTLSLKTLRICFETSDTNSYGPTFICAALLCDLDSARSPAALSTFSCFVPPEYMHPGWAAVIANSAESLRELRLSLRYPVAIDEDSAFYAAIFQCKALRKLTLATPNHDLLHISLRECIAELAARFASDPLPAFAQTLQEFHLAICGRIDDGFFTGGGSEVLTSLAHALLPGAYPALTDLRIVSHMPSTTTTEGERDVAGRILGALEPLREAGVQINVRIKGSLGDERGTAGYDLLNDEYL